MQRVSDQLNSLIEALIKIEQHLNTLNKELETNNSTEVEQLNDLIHQTTHETASEIGFNRIKIMYLAKFIDVKNQFKKFNLEEFEAIIDSDYLSPDLKVQLFKGKTEEEKQLLLKEIKTLKKTWAHEFDHQSFKKIKHNYLS